MGGAPKVSAQKINLAQQLKQTLKGYQETGQGFFDLNKQFSPQYTDLNLQTLAQTLFGSKNAPGELQTGTAANTYSRGADIADIYRYGPAGYDALMRANPGLAQSLGNANAQGAATFAPGSLMTNLQDTAKSQLALGGSLSPQEQNALAESTREGFADRGMLMGNQALGAELLNRDAAMQQRLGQRIQWAQGVEGQAGQDRSYLNSLASLNAGVYDPAQLVLGRGGSALASLGGSGGNGVGTAALMGTLQSQNLFNPQGGANVFAQNAQNQNQAAIANANSQAATNSGYLQAGASLLGTAIGALAFSDPRTKTKVRLLGKGSAGTKIHSFEYRDQPGRKFIGAMADEVEEARPEAVKRGPLGLKLLDYDEIPDAEFYEVPTLGYRKAA